MIGQGHFLALGHRGNPEVLPSGFEVINTKLGPLLAGYGKIAAPQAEPAMACFARANPSEVYPLTQMAENFWPIESTGFENPKPHSDDLMVHSRLVDDIRINEEGRYEVPLIFKTPNGEPPSNVELPTLRGLAIGRLESNVRSVSTRNPELLQELDTQFHGQIDRGEVEVVPEDEILTKETTVYMPHHSVIKTTSSTTKVREVYDGSAKFKDKMSMNDALHRGPVLLPPLMGMLLRARTAHVVI
ncbi:Pao retrotransposon peptidase family protein [Aphelenchoides avenae]|nr:Pao retrotransposon peptidase family protein [Aphelenchus avenae]